MKPAEYDVIIIGGGLAGLTTSMLLSDMGYQVAVFEKKSYPSHKVCGEYLSKEVAPLLDHLGIDVVRAGAQDIRSLHIHTGHMQLSSALSLGAWGISRFTLDHLFYRYAINRNVTVYQNEAVRSVKKEFNGFTIKTDNGFYQTKKVVGAYGKRDLLDKTLQRDFLKERTGYMAVKYHIDGSFQPGTIGLYPFRNGFAGIVKVDGNKTCLCYLMKRENMKGYKSISEMEKDVLYKNQFLASIMKSSSTVTQPVVINEFGFTFKELVKDAIYYTGDGAAMIAPVCGNGMSMALNGSILLASALHMDLSGRKQAAEKYYVREWKKQFQSRLHTGRLLQNVLMNEHMLHAFIPAMKIFPFMSKSLIRLTHGEPSNVQALA